MVRGKFLSTSLVVVFVSGITLATGSYAADMASPPNSLVVHETGNVGEGTGVQGFSLNGNNGNLTIQGILITSSRALKRDFERLDVAEVLDKVAKLPIQEWSYKRDPKVRHVGPTAENFTAAFGLSDTDQHISSVDADGVALAAIQGIEREAGTEERRDRGAQGASGSHREGAGRATSGDAVKSGGGRVLHLSTDSACGRR